MSKRLLSYLSYSFSVVTLSGCFSGCWFTSTHYEMVGNTTTLKELAAVHAVKKTSASDKTSTALRLQSVQDYAFSIGAQAAFAQYLVALEALLDQLDPILSRVYNFNAWMLPHHVLPPVLIQAQHAINLVDTQTMRIAGRTYRIIQNARLVSAPPHWRYDYLLKDAVYIKNTFPQSLIVDLLPKNKEEQQIWKTAIQNGWEAGFEQGRNNFMINLRSLERDLKGIILYRQLLVKGMVNAPIVAKADLGVTGDDQQLNVQDQIVRINTLSTFRHATEKWKPIIRNQQ